jgi:hypothetical protein
MTVSPAHEPSRTADTIAGILAASAMFASLVALAYRPMRIGPFAIAISLVAVAMGGRHSRLATAALIVSGACWITGMVIAVVLQHPIL